MQKQMSFTLQEGTLCPGGGLNAFGTPRMLRPPGEIPVLSLRTNSVEIKCSPLYGCAKTHTRRHFPEETFPEVRKAFEEAFAHKNMARKNAADVPELVTAAEVEETESESDEEDEEEVEEEVVPVPSARKPVRSRKPQYVVTSELEEKRKEWRKVTYELALAEQAAVDAVPTKSGKKEKDKKEKKENIAPSLRDTLWIKNHPRGADVAWCPICETNKIFPENFSAGHIVPESHGGETILDNLLPICKGCNLRMGTKHMKTYAWIHHGVPLFR